MSALPSTVARCPGRDRVVPEGEWPFPRQEHDCADCGRRRAAIADYMSGAKVEWMQAPTETPCPERLQVKQR